MKIGKRQFTLGAEIDEFSTDVTMVEASNTKVPTQGAVKTYIDTAIEGLSAVERNSDNIMLNAFRIAVVGDMTTMQLVDGFMDEYVDTTGIDASESPQAVYNYKSEYFTNIDEKTKLLLHFNGSEDQISRLWGNTDYEMSAGNFVFGDKASSSVSADLVAWHGFSMNKDASFSWNSQYWESAPWLQYEFYEPKVIKAYGVASVDADSRLSAPGSWVFQGSHNGTDWRDLHTVTGETFDPKANTQVEMALNLSVTKYYNMDNKAAYKFYRIKVTDKFASLGSPATPTASEGIIIQELQMFDTHTYFDFDSSSYHHEIYPVTDAVSIVAKTFGETDAYKANSALYYDNAYGRTFIKRLTKHQEDIRIIPELRQGNNANIDTVGGNTSIYGGSNWRPGGRVSASEWHSSYEPWKCFQRQNTVSGDAWYCNDTAGWPAWIMWESQGEESICTHYSLAASAVTIDGTPRTWKLSGNSGNLIPELGANHDMVPNMTSNVLPFSYEASASTEYSGTYQAHDAFDGVKTGSYGWTTPIATPSGWLQIKLDQERYMNRYSITSATGAEGDRSPKDWTVWGSTAPQASGWHLLDTVTGCDGWSGDEEREFFITPASGYQYYKIDVTANDGEPDYLTIQEWELGNVEVEVNQDDGAAYEAWTMYDRITYGTFGWESTQTSGWSTMVFPQEKTITAYDVTANYHSTYLLSNPRDWTLYGNNDDQAINTKYLAHFEGSDGATSNTTDDLWGRVATFAGTAQIDTAQFKFGSSSLLLNGTTDYLSYPTLGPQLSYDFSNQPFTIDAWIRFSSVTTGNVFQGIISNYIDTNNFWTLAWDEDNTRLTFVHKINNVNRANIFETWSPVVDTWYHVAVIRGWGGDIDRYALTVDGTILNTYTTETQYHGCLREAILYVGSLTTTTYPFAGHIDQPRITKGEALWTSNFTKPSSAMTVTWTAIDAQADQTGWRVNERRSYDFTNATPYRAYKWDIEANDGHGTYMMIQEFEMFEKGWTELDSQENTDKWMIEETRIYPVPSGNRTGYETYRLDISDPYLPSNIMNLGELTLFSEDPGSAYESTGDFEIGWDDFTVEGWYLWTSEYANENSAIFETGQHNLSEGVMVNWNNNGNFYCYSNGTNNFTRAWKPTFGRWHHIAYQRSNGAFQIFADGKQLGQDYQWNGYIRSHKYDPKMGAYSDITDPFWGYQKEYRYSNIARYAIGAEASGVRDFTPPSGAWERDDNTKLLVHGHSYNTDMQDYCAHFNNDFDWIGIPYNDCFKFEERDFTIETHFKVTQTSSQTIYSSGYTVATAGSMRIYISHNSSCIVDFAQGSYTFNFQFIQGTWYHLAVVRDGNRMRVYVNGSEIGSDAQKGIDVSSAGGINSTTSWEGDYVRIGEDFNANDYWGLMRNFRISDFARYTDNFYPPKEEYTSDDNTILLLPFKDPDTLLPPFGGYWMPDATHCHASTENSDTYRAWKALMWEKQLTASTWLTDGVNPKGWLEFELENAITPYSYAVGSEGTIARAPQDWTLKGTNTRPYNLVSLQNYYGCCIPRMQRNSCPGNAAAEWPDTMVHHKYQCSASSENNTTTNQAFNAFEYTGNSEWRTENLIPFNEVNGAWLMFDFTEDDKRIITQYGMRCGVVATQPTSWIFQASNDLDTWVDLDDHYYLEDRVGYPSVWVVNDRKYWDVENSTAYRYYRIFVREVSTLAQTYVTIRDFFMYDGSRGTASSSSGITTEGYKAFNGVLQNDYGWRTPTTTATGWLQYDFAPNSPQTIVRYDISNTYSIGSTASPQDWTFEGSNSDMKDYAPILNQFDTIALGRYRGAAKATASTTYSTWWPYNAFNHQYDLDGGTGGGWSSTTTTNSWLRIELDDPFAVQAYTIQAQLGTLTTLPKDWTFEGATEVEGYTTMLLHLEGADTSTTFTDTSLSPSIQTAVGSAQIDTAQFKFGTSSLLLNGSSDYVTIPLGIDYYWEDNLNFEGEDFCFEGWFRFNTTPDDFCLWGSSLVGSHFDIFDDTNIRIYDSWTPSDFINFETSTLATGTWYHIAIARDGDNLRVFLDGTQQDVTKNCGGHAYNHNSTGTHQLGAWNGTHYFNGWMDEVRISKGTSRYTTNFSVETSAWTDPAWVVLDTVTGETAWHVHERRKFDFVNAIAYKNYRLNISANDGGATYTRLQELELHTEGETWDVLDTVTGETTWVDDERKTFEFSNSTPYTSYKIDVTANNGATSLAIQELSLYEEQNWVTLDTVTGETGWTAWETRHFDIDTPASCKYFKFDITLNNGNAMTGLSYLNLLPEDHLAKDYSSYNHKATINGEVDRRYHEHWLSNIVQDDSRATEDESHMMYHVGTAATRRTCVTGNGSLYTWGAGDKIEIPYHDDFNFYAREEGRFHQYGQIIAPNMYQTDEDFTITWWSSWQSDTNTTWIDILRYQEGIENTFVSDTWRSYYDGFDFNRKYRPALHTWQHYACVRKGNSMYQFVDGKLLATYDVTRYNMKDVLSTYHIVIAYNNATNYYHLGQMDEVQIIKGEAKWTSDFKPPTIETELTTSGMTMVSSAVEATATPEDSRITVFAEAVGSMTLNTDLIAYVSRDAGTTWSVVTLEDKGIWDAGKHIYAGNVDITGQPSGTSMKYKYAIANAEVKLHGTGLAWSD